jgi:hypothetical protein
MPNHAVENSILESKKFQHVVAQVERVLIWFFDKGIVCRVS